MEGIKIHGNHVITVGYGDTIIIWNLKQELKATTNADIYLQARSFLS